MPFSRVDLIRAKTDRANQHIADLEVAINAFFDSHPYGVAGKTNHQTREKEWYLERLEEIPLSISAIAGDAIHNLRSALDHLIWQLVDANGQTHKRSNAFPVSDSAQEYGSADSRRKIKGVRRDAIQAIDALKPYHGGDETLWRLHCLNNRDKHRLLLPAVSALTLHGLLPSQREHMIKSYFGSNPNATTFPDLRNAFIAPTNAGFPLEVGKVFLSIAESEMEHNFTFRFGVVFNEPGICERQPVIETIKGFSERVERIVTDLAQFLL